MLKNLKEAVSGSFIYGLGNVLTRIVGFILLPLYTKELSTTEFGILGIAEATSQVIIEIIGLSLYRAFERFYWDKDFINKQKSIFFTILVILIFNSILFWVFAQGFISNLSFLLFNSFNFTYLLNLMFISSGLSIINNFVLSLIRMKQKTILYSIANLLRFSFVLVLTIVFLSYFQRKINGIYEALICGQIVFILSLSIFILKNLKPKFEPKVLKTFIKFSYPLIASSISVVMLANIDKYSIRALCTLQDVGLYTLGFKIANTVKVLFSRSIELAVTPLKYKLMNQKDSKRFYSKITLYVSLFIMFVVIGVSLFAKEVIEILSQKQEYYNAHIFVPMLGFAIFFDTLRRNLNFGLLITKKTNIISGMIIGMSILNLALNFIFIYFWNTIGAAIATLSTQAIFVTIMYNVSQKYYEIPYEVSKILKIIIVATIILLILPLLNQLDLHLRLILKTGALIMYPFILYTGNFLEPVEKNALKRIIKKPSKITEFKNLLQNKRN